MATSSIVNERAQPRNVPLNIPERDIVFFFGWWTGRLVVALFVVLLLVTRFI